MAQVAVAHLGDPAQPVLAAAGVLAWHEAEPSGELSSGSERPRIAHGGRYSRCRDEADPGDGFEPLAFRAAAVPAQQFGVDFADL